MSRKVRFTGPDDEAEFEGQVFKRGEWTETDIKRKFPSSFEIKKRRKA